MDILHEITCELNKIRMGNKGGLKYNEIKTLMKVLPNFNTIGIRGLVKFKILDESLTRGVYYFSSNPVHTDTVKELLTLGRKITRERNSRAKHHVREIKDEDAQEKIERFLKESSVSHLQMAKFLENTGNFKFQHRVETWESLE